MRNPAGSPVARECVAFCTVFTYKYHKGGHVYSKMLDYVILLPYFDGKLR